MIVFNRDDYKIEPEEWDGDEIITIKVTVRSMGNVRYLTDAMGVAIKTVYIAKLDTGAWLDADAQVLKYYPHVIRREFLKGTYCSITEAEKNIQSMEND